MRLRASLFCIFCMLIFFPAAAQHVLHIQSETDDEQEILASFNFQNHLPDSAAARQQLKHLVEALQEDGYLLAATKDIYSTPDTTFAILSIGKQFRLAKLSAEGIPGIWLSRTNWRQKSYLDKPFRYRQVSRLMQQLVEQAENSGYPFAAVKLDSVEIENELLVADLQMEEGPYIIFDTLKIIGDARISPGFLAAHLGVRYGEPYNQQKVREAETLLRSLPYLRVLQEPRVSFQNRQGTLYLELGQKKANVIDGVVGLLPDPQRGGKMMFTGQFDLLLQNPFGTGKKIELHWQRLNTQSQHLEVSYHHPYLFKSIISLNAGFSLLKEENRFVNRQLNGELQVRKGAGNTIRLIAHHKDSRLLGSTPDEGLAGFSLSQIGLGFNRQHLNDPLFPQRGYEFSAAITGGKKNVRAIAAEADSLEQDQPGSAMQYRATGKFRYYQPLAGQLIWVHSLEAGFLADDRLYLNDMYRLGGLTSLRGFREKNFFASGYVLSQLELRYMAGSDSWLFLFYDQSLMEQKLGNLHVTDWPLGCGAGLSLGTKSGTFNFVYGVGKSRNQAMSLSHSQVHFGYVNRF